MNKTVIITGASGNVGTAVVIVFLSKGYRVIATVASEEARETFAPHKDLQVAVVNLTSEAQSVSFVQEAIQQHHQIDGALLLVGGFAAGNVHVTSADVILKQLNLNFATAYNF